MNPISQKAVEKDGKSEGRYKGVWVYFEVYFGHEILRPYVSSFLWISAFFCEHEETGVYLVDDPPYTSTESIT